MKVVISFAYWATVRIISHLLVDCVGWYLYIIYVFTKGSPLKGEIHVILYVKPYFCHVVFHIFFTGEGSFLVVVIGSQCWKLVKWWAYFMAYSDRSWSNRNSNMISTASKAPRPKHNSYKQSQLQFWFRLLKEVVLERRVFV